MGPSVYVGPNNSLGRVRYLWPSVPYYHQTLALQTGLISGQDAHSVYTDMTQELLLHNILKFYNRTILTLVNLP
ncbi:hypothetical protein DSUL_20456 [Desulfovibrionales bacterium]